MGRDKDGGSLVGLHRRAGRELKRVEVPEVGYVHTERGSIAYQVFGEGDIDILLLNAWVQSIDASWDTAVDLRRWEFFAALGRVVMLDHRGFGSSDPLPLDRVGQLEEMSFDLEAVLDAVGIEQATVVADSPSGGYGALRLAVDHPGRVARLVLLNPRRAGGNAAPFASLEELAERTRRRWGLVLGGLGTQARFRSHLEPACVARYHRLAASPGVAAAMAVAMARTDVTPLLPRVTAPTLVVHTGDIVGVPAEESAAVAAAIPRARFLEAESISFYWGAWAEEIASFLTGKPWDQGRREVAAVAFTDVVGSTEYASSFGDREWKRILAFLDGTVERQATRGGGAVVKQTGDGHLLAFPRPSDALEVVRVIVKEAPGLGVHLRAGVHFGEVERRPNGDLGGLGVHVCARVSALAGPDEVLVTRTVAEMAAGGGWAFSEQGEHALRGVPERWQLLRLENRK